MPHRAAEPRAVRRKESFDDVADLYAAARPAYPQELVADLLAFAEHQGARDALEIGPGTGQLTVSLAEHGFDLVAIERGPNLARLLTRNVAQFANVTTVIADFDDWSSPPARFDVVIAATAFHWLDPLRRVEKCARLLRPGGALAIVETHWAAGDRDDRFTREGQGCYARWDPDHDPDFRPCRIDDLPGRNEELERSGMFDEVAHRRYVCRRSYDAHAYRDLLGTFSNILAFDQHRRERFLACILEVIESRFGGNVVRTDVYDLWIARASSPSPIARV